jgi:glyoxylase-like metal-dependent hydrolase (beta-lactamase superfamily II)
MIQIALLTYNPFAENTYVLYDESLEALVIDPGMQSPAEQAHFQEFVQQNQLKVVGLLNTHCHVDHVFGNQFVKDTYQVGLQIHKLDLPTLQAAQIAAQMYNIRPFVPSTPDSFLEAGEVINFGNNSTLEVLFVPGHAPGHVAFLSREQNFVIGGDVLFRQSIGRTDFPGCNHQDLLNSIRTQLFTLPNELRVYPGHGLETTIGYEKQYNPFLQD